MPRGLWMMLALWVSWTAAAAEPTARVDVDLVQADNALVGIHLAGSKPGSWLAGKLDNLPWSRASGELRLGDTVPVDTERWSASAREITGLATPSDGDTSFQLELEVQAIEVATSDAAGAARVRVAWRLLDPWGQELAKGFPAELVEGPSDAGAVVQSAFEASVRAAASTKGFQDAVAKSPVPPTLLPTGVPLTLKRCGGTKAGGLEDAIGATVVVRAGDKVGAGMLVSPDGWVVTAFHVVRDTDDITVRTQAGEAEPATLVRVAPEADAALLRWDTTDARCVAWRGSAAKVGEDVYSIGTPGGEALAFSVTRGIVSGIRGEEGVRLLQTDASINRGNSGGPLVDADGAWLAVVSFKIVGFGAEGIAFGVPAEDVVEALGVGWGNVTVVP